LTVLDLPPDAVADEQRGRRPEIVADIEVVRGIAHGKDVVAARRGSVRENLHPVEPGLHRKVPQVRVEPIPRVIVARQQCASGRAQVQLRVVQI
jgi:hypothetical protein